MQRRAHRPPPGLHSHCEKCFNQHCQAPINPGISCTVISCSLHCGARFHLCKEEEHHLLCPYEWVPCINSTFGCPLYMSRCKQAKHLTVCPASVVCCSMEWNRWPIIDKDQDLYENILKDADREECLDVALSLKDQKTLFGSLKMAELFPELSEHPQTTVNVEMPNGDLENGAVGGLDLKNGEDLMMRGEEEVVELTQYEREALARGQGGIDVEKFKMWENIFSKEKSAAKCLESRTGESSPPSPGPSKPPDGEPNITVEKTQQPDEVKKFEEAMRLEIEKTGLAPWQEGVLEKLKSELDCGSYNMYLVHHGSMLIRFGQMAACTPKEKDFVYGNLEAQTVKTVCTFKVPTSYCGRRAKLGDDRPKREKAQKLVDTSDLAVQEENLQPNDIINTTLLCALERELKGHAVSEMKALDGLLIDFGTQTYNFGLDLFTDKTVLSDVLAKKNMKKVGFYMDIDNTCVNMRHNKSNSSFTFSCSLFFRRNEFPSHFKNVHGDIQSGLNGWFQQRCPLSYLGCTFLKNRFQTEGQRSQVIYSKQLKTFALKPQVDCTLYQGVKPNISRSHRGKSKDSLSSLPAEILQHIAGFLDSFSLCQLSQVSTLMRDVCAMLLQERGMVHLYWEKKTYSHGGSSWRCRKKVWNFSSLFSPIQRWKFDDISSMSEHLKVCPYNCPEGRKDRFKLPSLYGPRQEKESLLNLRRKLKAVTPDERALAEG